MAPPTAFSRADDCRLHPRASSMRCGQRAAQRDDQQYARPHGSLLLCPLSDLARERLVADRRSNLRASGDSARASPQWFSRSLLLLARSVADVMTGGLVRGG